MASRQQRVMVQPIVGLVWNISESRSLIFIQNVIFKNLQQASVSNFCLHTSLTTLQKTKVVIWLYDNIEMRIEGKIIVCSQLTHVATCSQVSEQGFDEFMNIVVDDAAEIYVKEAKPRRELGEQLHLSPLTTHRLWHHRSHPFERR